MERGRREFHKQLHRAFLCARWESCTFVTVTPRQAHQPAISVYRRTTGK
jgi:hypothetical protein